MGVNLPPDPYSFCRNAHATGSYVELLARKTVQCSPGSAPHAVSPARASRSTGDAAFNVASCTKHTSVIRYVLQTYLWENNLKKEYKKLFLSKQINEPKRDRAILFRLRVPIATFRLHHPKQLYGVTISLHSQRIYS